MKKLIIKALGGCDIHLENSDSAIPTKKARALIVYLALSRDGIRSREHLANMFWSRSAEEQARASLRQTLSSIRKVMGNDAEIIGGDADNIFLSLPYVQLDVLKFIELAQSGDFDTCCEAEQLYSGQLLDGFSLRENEFEDWLLSERRHLHELAIQLLSQLIEQSVLAGDAEKGIVYCQRLLNLDVLHEKTHRTLMTLYARLGRREAAIKQYDEYNAVWERELGIKPATETTALYESIRRNQVIAIDNTKASGDSTNPEQIIDYCTTADGTKIAYAIAGEGPALVKTANWLNHLEYDWVSPVWKHHFQFLTQGHKLIRYDERGNGLSDWDTDEISTEAFVADLESVVNAAKLDKFALLGISQGCIVSILYSLRYPEKVSHLILLGGYPQGNNVHASSELSEKWAALRVMISTGWGKENPAFRQLFSNMFIPGASQEQINWFNDLQKVTASSENAIKLSYADENIDISELLSQVSVPTLVLHSRGDEVVPLTQGEKLAMMIPGARLVVLESNNHLILENEPAWSVYCREVNQFLRRTETKSHQIMDKWRLSGNQRSIAVLPFQHLSGDPHQQFLADGITEDLVANLSHDRLFTVLDRASTIGLDTPNLDVLGIAGKLGVRYIVNGSVRKSDDRIRVTASLIDSSSGAQIWNDKYNRVYSDMFELQDEIAANIASAIIPELNHSEQLSASRKQPDNLDAWGQFHRGFWHLYKFETSDLEKAIAYFKKALDHDPGFSQAYAGLAYGQTMLVWYDSSKQSNLSEARENALTAISFDSRDSFSYFALGHILSMQREYQEAVAAFEKSIELNPSFGRAYFGLASVYNYWGKHSEVLSPVETAIKLSPADPHLWTFYNIKARALIGLGRYDEGEYWARKSVRQSNSTYWADLALIAALGFQGLHDEASRAIRDLQKKKPGYSIEQFRHSSFMLSEDYLAEAIDGLRRAGMPESSNLSSVKSGRPSIAVLRFRNLSGDPQQDYFSDGMSEEIINGLSRMQAFTVIARNSSFIFNSTGFDLKEISEKLSVSYLVTGSVRKYGNQVRISVALTDITSAVEIWSVQYDGELENTFDLQDQITRNVVTTIEPKIRQSEIDKMVIQRPETTDAYDYYLRALPYFHTLTLEGTTQALKYLKSALRINPNYYRAQSFAAWCCTIRQTQQWTDRDVLEPGWALELARGALKSATDDPEVLWQAAYAAGFFGSDFSEFYPQFEKSISLNPNGAQAWVAYGLALLFSGEGEKALEKFYKSIELNPLDPLVYRPQMGLAMSYLCLYRFDESIQWGKKAMLGGPDYFPVLRTTAAALAHLDRFDEAKEYINQLLLLFPDSSIELFEKNFPHRDPAYRKIYIDGLRKAGLPETSADATFENCSSS
ncbi:MAG: TolB-like protein/DNA-binding SARP family transcriptional activator [Parasphingorhabdus sp.]|jgi:TolB-like protein/DNA-binding SARP family transcriptional activator/pimeloyl-ACP methyl ester carboxylesterase/Tfp pilus assembly protein PilF